MGVGGGCPATLSRGQRAGRGSHKLTGQHALVGLPNTQVGLSGIPRKGGPSLRRQRKSTGGWQDLLTRHTPKRDRLLEALSAESGHNDSMVTEPSVINNDIQKQVLQLSRNKQEVLSRGRLTGNTRLDATRSKPKVLDVNKAMLLPERGQPQGLRCKVEVASQETRPLTLKDNPFSGSLKQGLSSGRGNRKPVNNSTKEPNSANQEGGHVKSGGGAQLRPKVTGRRAARERRKESHTCVITSNRAPCTRGSRRAGREPKGASRKSKAIAEGSFPGGRKMSFADREDPRRKTSRQTVFSVQPRGVERAQKEGFGRIRRDRARMIGLPKTGRETARQEL